VTSPVGNRSAAVAFELHARRAEALARATPAAEEPLRFVAGLCRAQARTVVGLEALHGADSLTGVLAADVERVLPRLLDVARFAAEAAPAPLAGASAAKCEDAEPTAKSRLALFWDGELKTAQDYLSRAMLRPYVETLRTFGLAPDRQRARGRCPFCGGAPIVGCRRGGSESEGAARFLSCALCGLEWRVARIVCPACFEDDPHKLPAFASPTHPIARIEACETCRRYVKSLDLSQDARPAPEIDDVASLSLDLWAVEQGFERLEPGLAGV
jgi:FdhE protein